MRSRKLAPAFVFGAILLFAGLVRIPADTSPYPLIREANLQDPSFRQLTRDIADARRAIAGGASPSTVLFYRIAARSFEDLFELSAMLDVGIQTIATVNRLEAVDDYSPDATLIIPNVPGVFIAERPGSDIELMLAASYATELHKAVPVVLYTPGEVRFRFLPGREFTPLDTAFFLGVLFRFPLPAGTVTSRFGPRADPFSGEPSDHHGLDIAAPAGTEVYASREGVVIDIGFDEVLGNYCVLLHATGYTTVYAHLERSTVEIDQEVRSGTGIGIVGSTGKSTGPHLHFEIRRADGPRNPESFLRLP